MLEGRGAGRHLKNPSPFGALSRVRQPVNSWEKTRESFEQSTGAVQALQSRRESGEATMLSAGDIGSWLLQTATAAGAVALAFIIALPTKWGEKHLGLNRPGFAGGSNS